MVAISLSACCAKGKTEGTLSAAPSAAPIVAVPSAPPRPAAPYVATLAALAANPSAQKPTKVSKYGKGVSRTYKVAGTSSVVLVTVEGQWVFTVGATETVDALAENGLVSDVCEPRAGVSWYRIDAGPLRTAYARVANGAITIANLEAIRKTAQMGGAEGDATKCAAIASCKAEASLAPHQASAATLWTACRELVRGQLKAPSEADFQGITEGLEEPQWTPACTMLWTSWVDAPNSFGVKMRSRFTCTWNPQTDRADIAMLP